MKGTSLFCAAALLLCAPLAASEQDGAVHVKSRYSVEDTVERARRMLEHQGMRVFGVIDHQEEAKRVGQRLLPTRLLVFGIPETGARILLANRVAALDLPLRLLVWEAANGTVWVTYLDAEQMARRYEFSPDDGLFAQLGEVLRDLARAAAN